MIKKQETVKKRIAMLFFAFIVLYFLLVIRLSYVQLLAGQELAEKAVKNRIRDVEVEAKRGNIYDRNMKELAISVPTASVYLMPPEIRNSKPDEEAINKLALILEMEATLIKDKISKNSRFEWLKRQLELDKAEAIKALKIRGLELSDDNKRFYPKGSLASHVLGISGVDNTGLEGIDLYYNDIVGGSAGRIIVEYDAIGREIPETTRKYVAPIEGVDIVLTIDESIQYIAEKALMNAVEKYSASAATVIVMAPHSGEVLALASLPNFDPNYFDAYPTEHRRNYAVNQIYEPGSTMKIINAAIYLEESLVNPEKNYFCTGHIRVDGEVLYCNNRVSHGAQSFTQAVESSCNVVFAEVAQELGVERYYSYLRAFGFGSPTGIDLPGEASGILVPKQSANPIDLATMSIGQANAVTPIQLITAVAAVANGGNLMQAHLLKEVRDKKGNILQENEPMIKKQVLSRETCLELSAMLESSVIEGTGIRANIEGYRVAGKTGTAQKISPKGGYLKDEYVASFVAYAPVDEPRLVCLVVLDNPQGISYYGGVVAAPVVREILQEALYYLQVPLNQGLEEELIKEDKVIVPDLINKTWNQAQALSNKGELLLQKNSEGNLIWQQYPRAYTRVPKGSLIDLSLSEFDPEDSNAILTVPDLQGKSLRASMQILQELDLILIPDGYGIAYQQSPEAGSMITRNSSIKVYFKKLEQKD